MYRPSYVVKCSVTRRMCLLPPSYVAICLLPLSYVYLIPASVVRFYLPPASVVRRVVPPACVVMSATPIELGSVSRSGRRTSHVTW